MKRLANLVIALLLIHAVGAQNKTGSICGIITDKATGETLPFANIVVKQNNLVVLATASDFDGKYSIQPLDSGFYDVECSFSGYGTLIVKAIKVGADRPTLLNFSLEFSSDILQEIWVISDAPGKGKTAKRSQKIKAEEVRNLPFRNSSGIVATSAAVFSTNDGQAVHIRGSRNRENVVFIDGVKVRGNVADTDQEQYNPLVENPYQLPTSEPLSTFGIDVDGASYANVRRFLKMGSLPPVDAVRVEECINYFSYDYPEPTGEDPFSITTELVESPWHTGYYLLHIGLKGKTNPTEELPRNNLVFLLDVSGSMQAPNKLELVKKSLKMLINQLDEDDRIAIVVYAGASGLALPATKVGDKQRILEAIAALQAGGSTAGAQGIELAYEVASKEFIKNGNNRILLCTDGDFNVGISNQNELVKLIESKRDQGIFLSVFGFGMGNLKDGTMEQLANHGNGTYNYIDNLGEAQKVFVNEANSTLFTIAKDVKIQIEFNPDNVAAYRLIGYENRLLAAEDFNNDKKDAGEIGAGHTVTALYEIVPAGAEMPETLDIDPLKYQKTASKSTELGDELATVKFRYKQPTGKTSQLLSTVVQNHPAPFGQASANAQFSAAVAAWGMMLRNSAYKGTATYQQIIDWGNASKGIDTYGYRSEFVQLVRLSKELDERSYGSVD